jgi:hypothetical protein
MKKPETLGAMVLSALFLLGITVAATSYTWYPQSWTRAELNDAGSGHPMASGRIHYKLESGLSIKPTTHLPNGLPGFTDFWWTGDPCELRLDDDTSTPVYHLLEYNAVLKDESDTVLETVYVGCPVFGNIADFKFESVPVNGEEYTARIYFEDANTNDEIAFTNLIEFGKPEVVDEEPINGSGFVNDLTSKECYLKCRYDGEIPFDNCAEHYVTSHDPNDRYKYIMSWFLDHNYCIWA